MTTLPFPPQNSGKPRTSRRGRPPKPTAQKILEGNRGRRPLDPLEPKPPEIAEESALPPPPPHLTPFAAEIWKKELGPLLVQMRVLTEADLTALAILCQAEARRRVFEKDVQTNGVFQEVTTVTGDVVQRTRDVYKELERITIRVSHLLLQFGFTPASRPKVQSVPDGGKKKKGEEEEYDPFG